MASFGGAASDEAGAPNASLSYQLYDLNYNLVDQGFIKVSTDAAVDAEALSKAHEQLILPTLNIDQAGYLNIELRHDLKDGMAEQAEVYFDDFEVTHTYSNVLVAYDRAAIRYYPFGLPMENRQMEREKTRYKYQGAYAEEDEETGYLAFQLRFYDARIGRWVSPDPYGQFHSPYVGMGNIPHMGSDPDGGMCCADVWAKFGDLASKYAVTASRVGTAANALGTGGAILGGIERGISYNGPELPYKQNGYLPQISSRLPDASSLRPQETLSAYEPTFVDNWSQSTNIAASATYDIADGLYLTGQMLFRLPHNRTHLTGAGVTGSDLADGFVSTAATLMPAGAARATTIQRHHVIPNAVYKQFQAQLDNIGWFQNHGLNLKKLPTPFHGNHPAYNKYVARQIQNLHKAGNLTMKNMEQLQHSLRAEINEVYLSRQFKRMNHYFKSLGF